MPRKPAPGVETNATIVKRIADELGLNPTSVNATIRVFFSFRGLKGEIKQGNEVKIRNLGSFKKDRKRRLLDRRRSQVVRITERVKKNKFNHKSKLTK